MTFKTNNIEVTSGLTADNISGTTVSGVTYYGSGGFLTDIPDTFVTASTFVNNDLILDLNNGSSTTATIDDLTGITVDLDSGSTINGLGFGDSRLKHWAEIFENFNSLVTNITATTTPTKVNTTSQLGGSRGFSMPIDNRITYTATTTGQTFVIQGTISAEAASGSQVFQVSIYRNGVDEIESTIIENEFTSARRAVAFTGTVQLGENEYIELWCQNNTSNKNFELYDFNVTISQI